MSGTKVSTEPESLHVSKVENPGVVTSDSLAAESINEGGTFAADSKARGVSGPPSSSTTTNTTDTSSATKLDPAHSRADRTDGITYDRAEGFAGAGQPSLNSGVFNVPKPAQPKSTTNTAGQASETSAERDTQQSQPSEPVQPPHPKGKDLKEPGDITGDEENASFTTNIGSKNDPGRKALEKIELDNARSTGTANARANKLDTDTPYDALGGSTSA